MPASDGCTLFPEGWWAVCCYAHDAAYWLQDVARLDADLTLAMCVAATGAVGATVAAVMFVGVRLGGWLPWRRHKRSKT